MPGAGSLPRAPAADKPTSWIRRSWSALSSAALVRDGLASAALRGLTLAAKLLFVVYIGKHLAVEDMAVYGLLVATVAVSVTLLGCEFNAFSQREFLARAGAARTVCIRDQLAFHLVAYLVLIPAAAPVFVLRILPWSVAPFFYAIAIAEHLGQELARVLNNVRRPVLSSALFFVRSAAWGVPVVVLSWWRVEFRSLTSVLVAWTAAEAVALLLAAVVVARMDWSVARAGGVDWRWVRRGLVVAAPFFLSAASYRVIELADRYIIHFLLTDEAVAVYSFYSTLANVLPAVAGAGITAVLTPRIIEAFQQDRMEEYRRYYRLLNIATVGLLAVAGPATFLLIVALQAYLGRPEYARALGTCAVLLVSTASGILAQLPGVALYARHCDITLLKATVIGAVSNTAFNVVLIPPFGITGAAWATTIAYAAMGGYQGYRLFRLPLPARTPGLAAS